MDIAVVKVLQPFILQKERQPDVSMALYLMYAIVLKDSVRKVWFNTGNNFLFNQFIIIYYGARDRRAVYHLPHV